MFYDLNLPWSPNDQNLTRTLAFAHELGYNVVALNRTICGKLPADLTNPITLPQSSSLPSNLTILRRLTLTLTESHQNARLTALAKEYDLLALRPIDERTLQLACTSLDCDIISLDLTLRLPFFFKYKTLSEAIKSGKRFEINYSQGLLGDPQARRNLISNATQLIRASRGRGLILSSETKAEGVGLRGPWDAINLACVWGLGQERGYEAMSKECRSVVVSAQLKRTSYRGVVDVVYGGEKPVPPLEKEVERKEVQGKQKQGQKRKAESLEGPGEKKRKSDAVEVPGDAAAGEEKPISKREAKRRAKAAREQTAASTAAPIAAEGASQVQNSRAANG